MGRGGDARSHPSNAPIIIRLLPLSCRCLVDCDNVDSAGGTVRRPAPPPGRGRGRALAVGLVRIASCDYPRPYVPRAGPRWLLLVL